MNLTQLAPIAVVLCGIIRNDGYWTIQAFSWSLKVADFGRPTVYNFLLVNNTNTSYVAPFTNYRGVILVKLSLLQGCLFDSLVLGEPLNS